jgi:PilZ domain
MAPTIADAAASPVYEQVRRWPRHKIDIPVRAVIHKPDRKVILDGRGMEMSEGGVCLLMDIELGLGDKIELELTSPYSGKPIRVRSVVCNRDEYRYGVQFIPEGEKERSEVARLRQMLNPFEDAAYGSAGVKHSYSPPSTKPAGL